MKKLFCIILLIITVKLGYSFNYNFSIEDLPMMVMGTDTTNAAFYSFYNIANVGLSLNFDDYSSVKFRLKDTYFDLLRTNDLYIDRLSFDYKGEAFGVLAGRDYFVEDDALLIGNLADGLKLNLNFLGLKERVYVYYSGLLPQEINQFDISTADLTLSNGPNRIFAGLALEKMGLLVESLGAVILYSKDLSTNNIYNPIYLGLNGKGTIVKGLIFQAAFISELGSLDASNSIVAFGGNAGLTYLSEGDVKWGLIGKLSLATGDSPGGNYEQFDTFGNYNTGSVIGPKLANLFMVQAGFLVKALSDTLTFGANYYYLMRMTTNDSVNGFYDGKGTGVGNEISGSIIYDIDPNFSVFLTGGYFLKGDAFTDTTNKYKFIAGVRVKI